MAKAGALSREQRFLEDETAHAGRAHSLMLLRDKRMYIDRRGWLHFLEQPLTRPWDPIPVEGGLGIKTLLLIDADTSTLYAEVFPDIGAVTPGQVERFLLRAWLEKHYDAFRHPPERLLVTRRFFNDDAFTWLWDDLRERYDMEIRAPQGHETKAGATYATSWSRSLAFVTWPRNGHIEDPTDKQEYHPFARRQRRLDVVMRLDLPLEDRDGYLLDWSDGEAHDYPFQLLQAVAPLLAAQLNVDRTYLWNLRPPPSNTFDVLRWHLREVAMEALERGDEYPDPLWWLPPHLRYLFLDFSQPTIYRWPGRPMDLTEAIRSALFHVQMGRQQRRSSRPFEDVYPIRTHEPPFDEYLYRPVPYEDPNKEARELREKYGVKPGQVEPESWTPKRQDPDDRQ